MWLSYLKIKAVLARASGLIKVASSIRLFKYTPSFYHSTYEMLIGCQLWFRNALELLKLYSKSIKIYLYT